MIALLIDNNDSFVHNLKHALLKAGVDQVHIVHHQVAVEDLNYDFDLLVLSPGPGLPKQSGNLMAYIDRFHDKKPILGICLGHQALAEYFGASLYQLPEVKHGISNPLKCVGKSVHSLINYNDAGVGRYHSWAVSSDGFSDCLVITAMNEMKIIMAFQHNKLPIEGWQFHPESYLTSSGVSMLSSFLITYT